MPPKSHELMAADICSAALRNVCQGLVRDSALRTQLSACGTILGSGYLDGCGVERVDESGSATTESPRGWYATTKWGWQR